MEREDHLFEELCKKGKAYRAKRMAAGEKSSAYLSGRAVKVCKGQMKSEDSQPNFANQKYYDLLNDLRDEGHLHRYGVVRLQLKFGLKEKEAQEIYNQYKEDLKAEQPDAYDFYMKDLNEEKNCGCKGRKDKLNKMFPYKK